MHLRSIAPIESSTRAAPHHQPSKPGAPNTTRPCGSCQSLGWEGHGEKGQLGIKSSQKHIEAPSEK